MQRILTIRGLIVMVTVVAVVAVGMTYAAQAMFSKTVTGT